MKVQVRLNAISSYHSQQSSPAIRDITVSGHMRHHHLWPDKKSPSPAIQDISVSGCTRHLCLRLRPVYAILPHLLYTVKQETKQNEMNENKVILIAAFLKPCDSEQGKSTAVA
jgi:hypothetical protein